MAQLELQKGHCDAFNRSQTYILDDISNNGPPMAAVVSPLAQLASALSFDD